jgi:hypothetical protein
LIIVNARKPPATIIYFPDVLVWRFSGFRAVDCSVAPARRQQVIVGYQYA